MTTGLASSPPAAVRTPSWPAGTCTVTWLAGLTGAAGRKVSAGPACCQLPGTAGLSVGIGEPAASGAENVMTTGLPPSTPRAPEAGEIAVTRSGVLVAWPASAAFCTPAAWLPEPP